MLIAVVIFAGNRFLSGDSTRRGHRHNRAVQSVVAKQAALVSEFEVNGLKVLVETARRKFDSRRGSLYSRRRGKHQRAKRGHRNVDAQRRDRSDHKLSTRAHAQRTVAHGHRDWQQFKQRLLGALAGHHAHALRSSWQIFTDVALRPSFTKEDVALVQERLVVSLSDDTDNPDVYLQKLQERVAYAGHPYLNNTSGTPETVAKLTPEDLRQYHTKLMETSRLLLVIVGDLNPAEVRTLVTASFGKLPRGNYKPEAMPQLAFDKSSVEITPRELPTNYIQGLFTAPSLTSPDIYAMRIASSLLRDRVFEEVRVKRNLSYAPDAFLRTQAANVGGLYVTAVDANQSIRVMLSEIARLQNEPVSADDIHAVVAQYLTTYYLGQETNAAQAGELAQYELIGGGWRNSVDFLERLTAVTPADIQRVSQKYMRNIRFVVLGNPRSVDTGVFTGQAG